MALLLCTCVIAERISTQHAAVILASMSLPASLFAIICLVCIVKTIAFYAGSKYRRSKIIQIQLHWFTYWVTRLSCTVDACPSVCKCRDDNGVFRGGQEAMK